MFNVIKRIFCCSKNNGVYRLLLKNNKIYIGKSTNIEKRISKHFKNKGSYWTRKFNVIKRLCTLTTYTNNPFWELQETLENMNKYGIDNVRGSMFSKYNLDRNEKILAAQLYCEMNDLCKKCGSPDHFITQCKAKTVEPWVLKFGGELDINQRKCQKCFKNINDKPDYYKYCEGCFSM